MLTKFSNVSQFNLQAWVVQEVDDQCYPPDKSQSIQWITWFVQLTLIYWRVIYPVDSIVQPSNKWGQDDRHGRA